MKGLLRAWASLAMLAVALPGYAQKEQWLEYHTSQDGRGYRYIQLSTNVPANVTLPKLNSPAWFGRWTTPLEPGGGRWVCLDRTRKSAPCDRWFIDCNGNGRLDDETPLKANSIDESMARFDPARLVFKGPDGTITYHISAQYYGFSRSAPQLLTSSSGWYEGKIEIGGKKRRLELIDANVNGIFNDTAAKSSDCDHVLVEGDKAGERFLGKMLEVDGAFYYIDCAQDGAFVKLRKAEDVQLGQVRVPEAISEMVAFGESGYFVRQPGKGECTLPVGKYRVYQWKINRKDAKGAAWEMSGYGANNFTFQVETAKVASLNIGEPLRAVLSTSETPQLSNEVRFSLEFKSAGSENIQIMKAGQRPPGPKLVLASADGTYHSTNTFEFG